MKAALFLGGKSCDLGTQVGFWAVWEQAETLAPTFTFPGNQSEELKLACGQFCVELGTEAMFPGP